MGVTSHTPAKNRFRAHGDSHYYLATELHHSSEQPFRGPGFRGPTLRYIRKPANSSAAEQDGGAAGSATSSAFRDVDVEPGYVMYNIGDSIYTNDIRGLDQAPMDQLRLRSRPSTHDWTWTPSGELEVAIGFSSGEIMSYLPLRKETPTTHYSRGNYESAGAVTDIRWVPNKPGCFVAAHALGSLLVYDTNLSKGGGANLHKGPASSSASSDGQPASAGGGGEEGLSASTRRGALRRSVDRKGLSSLSLWRSSSADERKPVQAGPVACWHICQSPINQLAFSHDGRHLAMVSADGLLRIFEFATEQLIVSFHSYYAGLLCVAWDPTDNYLLTGGEDDLVSVWALRERRLLARAQGHSSWVTCVAFDAHAPGSEEARVAVDPAAVLSLPPGGGLVGAKAQGGGADLKSGRCDSPPRHANGSTGASTSAYASTQASPTAERRQAGSAGAGGEGGGQLPTRKLCFGSVGMDTKLLLWELHLDEGEGFASLELHSAAEGGQGGQPVSVLHARGPRSPMWGRRPEEGGRGGSLRGGDTAAPPAGRPPARSSRLPQLGAAAAHECHFSVEAREAAELPPPGGLSGRGSTPLYGSAGARGSHGSGTGDAPTARPMSHLVLAALPLSATPVLSPIGGVAAHAEPVTHVAFAQSAIVTACLGGTVRLWIPRVPPSAIAALPGPPITQAPCFALVTVQMTAQAAQQTIFATSKSCYIDPALASPGGGPSSRGPKLSY
ncbi:WD40-repeat-containing domain protein [Pavlovales sp. CCMP2436]|nr:WD40-repeat-containing domain protein [Pavlovales sp. CCMP2436]